ncbi:hypothetical protein [Demequina subtropica]|uniref:hypothetical protein n=1 Tax=Demequina subtropica TaxID=1638989 RepID=UPI000783979D|nr:hypothetical protein [Demequina subtropica]
MSSELEKAMERRAAAGLAQYGGRADAMVPVARARVRRARAMRALGTAGLAAVAVGAVTTVAIATGAGETVAPATTSPTPSASSSVDGVRDPHAALTAEDLLAERVANEDMAQIAILCDGAVPQRSCEEVRFGDWDMLQLEPDAARVDVSVADTTAIVGWGVTYQGDAPLSYLPDHVIPQIEPTWDSVDSAITRLTDISIQMEAEPATIAPGGTATGEANLGLGQGTTVVPGATVDMTVLVPVPFADPADSRELWLLASFGGTSVIASDADAGGDEARTASDLRDAEVERHLEDFDRGSAQAGLDCTIDPGLNPRTDTIEQEAFDPICDTVWLSDETPMLRVTEMTFDVDEANDVVRIGWTLQNTSGAPLALDTGGMTLAIEQPVDAMPLNDGGIVFTADGTLLAGSLWASETERFGLVQRASAVETVQPWQLVAGEREVFLSEIGDLATARFSVQVRVAHDDDAVRTPELFLESTWEGGDTQQ